MLKTITTVGDAHGIILEPALLKSANLKPGDQVTVEVHAGGKITLTPLPARHSPEELSQLLESTMKDYARTMKKLA
jgi:antitoxin component of MazEF toxin-antitoxin module